MPNHVTNILTLTGSAEDIAKIKELAHVGEEDFSFEGLVPMPTQIKNTVASSISSDEPKYEVRDGVEVFMENSTEEGRASLQKKYGCTNWYDWACTNWGTKWGSYDSTLEDEGEDFLQYTFLTAWSFPEEFFLQFSQRFPDVHMKVRFADEDFGNNCGEVELMEGDFTEAHYPEGGSREAFELAGDILGHCGEWDEEKDRYVFEWEEDEEEEEIED